MIEEKTTEQGDGGASDSTALLARIREMERELEKDRGDVLIRVRLGELKKRYRSETGHDVPAQEIAVVGAVIVIGNVVIIRR